MIVEELKFVFDKNKDKNALYLRNLLKEQLQYYVLNFIYNSLYGEKFLFKGGTCLRFCFDLPRLSEDLDFDVKDFSSFDYQIFIKDLKEYFVSKLKYKDFEVKVSGKNRLIYLKFPILKKIGFPLEKEKPSENILFLRIDLSEVLGKNFKEEISLKSTWDFSFLIKRYSLSDIFSGKLASILSR
jgi:predicted nucleotidyltransferase component of viral defense system